MPLDEQTSRLKLKKPAQPNTLKHDVERLRDSLDVLDDKVATLDPKTRKLSDDQIPADVARLDPTAGSTIPPAQLPDVVPQMVPEANGDLKIKREHLPDEAVTNTHIVASEVLMLDLDASIGDVAKVTGTGKTYELIGTPITDRGNWKELVTTAVTSVNGETGDVVVAAPGVNSDITELTALSGPLTLGGDGSGLNDAVTMRQLQGAMGTSGGASMSGVMNDFIGAVAWFNGSRASLPAGYIAADGQPLSQIDPKAADLWAAVKSGMYQTVSDKEWLEGPGTSFKGQFRGKYSDGGAAGTCPDKTIKDAWFRIPDLNGVLDDSTRATFLRGDGGGKSTTTIGTVGEVLGSGAPEIYGEVSLAANLGYFSAFHQVSGAVEGYTKATSPTLPSSALTGPVMTDRFTTFSLAASRSSPIYGRKNANMIDGANEVRPNSVTGIWIIRANGSFVSANSEFSCINQIDPASMKAGEGFQTGFVKGVVHDSTGQVVNAVGMVAANTIGGSPVARFGVADWDDASKALKWKHIDLAYDTGATKLPAGLQASSVVAYGTSPTKEITQLPGGKNFYAGSYSGSFMVLFPDGNSSPGIYVTKETGGGYSHILQGNVYRGAYVFTSNNSFYVPNVPSSSYALQWANAPFRAESQLAASGDTQFQPVCSIFGGTQGHGYHNGVAFGKFTEGKGTWGIPAIVGGTDDVQQTGVSVNNTAFLFGTNNVKPNNVEPPVQAGAIGGPGGLIVPNGSDRRIKSDIKPMRDEDALARVEQVELYSFTMLGRKTHGVIAQDMEQIDPDYVFQSIGFIDGEEVKDFRSLNTLAMLADAMAAIKVLAAQNRDLQAQIDELKAKP